MTEIRSFLFLVAFYGWSALVAIAFTPALILPRPATAWMLRFYGRGVTVLLRVICGIRVEVRGRERLPTGPALIAPKHQCMFDIFGQFPLLPDACFVLRKELMRIPWFGWYAAKDGMIVLDREGQAAALKKLVRETRTRVGEGRQVVIFPEGTRGRPGAPGDYKPGIAALYRELDMPVIPVALNTGVHWQKFLRTPGTIVFEYLEPIPAGLKRAEFMRELQTRIDEASDALLDR